MDVVSPVVNPVLSSVGQAAAATFVPSVLTPQNSNLLYRAGRSAVRSQTLSGIRWNRRPAPTRGADCTACDASSAKFIDSHQ